MSARPPLYRLAVALALALAGPTWAQKGLPEPPAPRGASGGIGIHLDLGALWRTLAARRPTARSEDAVPGRIVGVWEADAPLDPEALARAAEAKLLEAQRLEALSLALAVLEVPAEQTDAALEALRVGFPKAVFGPQVIYTPATDGDDARGRPLRYAARLIGAPEPTPRLPAPVRIGIIDGRPEPGLALETEDSLELALVEAPEGESHASAVACILACAPTTGASGLARGASLRFAAVLKARRDGRAASDTYTVARALDALIGQRVDLIHMSLGGAPDAVLGRVLERVLPRVRAFVAAGGNRGPEGKTPYPAAHPGVIAVAAVDADARPWRGGTRGPHIAIAAPGVDLWLPLGAGGYFTGTSFAAPFVTAVLAQRLAQGQSTALAALCAEAIDLPPAGHDTVTGCGLLRWPYRQAAPRGGGD